MQFDNDVEKQCVAYLRQKCNEKEHLETVSDDILLRFAASNDFEGKVAWKKLKKMKSLYVLLSTSTTRSLIKQLKTKVSR